MKTLHRNFIGGEWVEGIGITENRNPSRPGELIGLYARSGRDELNAAVAAAQIAQPVWAAATPQVRADVLSRAGAAILARASEIGRLLAREEGKSLPEAIGEATRAGHIFTFFAGEALRMFGQKVESMRPGVEVDVMRGALGVVGLITPWNFPIAIPAWKAAPALAAGNAVVLKPAEITPACAHVLAQILEEAGCPAGVFNLVMGSGSTLGQALVENPAVAAISFTGSERIGRQIALGCAATLKKVQLEMGGKNPMVVMDDADMDVAVKACLNGAFYSTGQRCTASSRLIVQKGIHDKFVHALDAARVGLRVGDPLDEGTQIGPVVSEGQLTGNLEYVALAASEGCEVRGGERLNREGWFQQPALFIGAKNEMRSSRE